MKKLMLVIVLLTFAFLYFGCNESPQNITSATQTDRVLTPFKGAWEGETHILGLLERLITCQGNSTHLGLFTADVHYFITYTDPQNPLLGGTLTNGDVVMVAANGDKLYLANVEGTWWIASPTEPMVGFACHGIISGGTGRFADATGDFSGSGTQELFTSTQKAWYDWTGKIMY